MLLSFEHTARLLARHPGVDDKTMMVAAVLTDIFGAFSRPARDLFLLRFMRGWHVLAGFLPVSGLVRSVSQDRVARGVLERKGFRGDKRGIHGTARGLSL